MKQHVINSIAFVIQPQSIVDVITNSSSELFVFQGNDKEVIEGMISNIYPNYRDEYQELKSIHDLNAYEMYSYLGWVYEIGAGWNQSWHYECVAPKGINIEDITVKVEDKFDSGWYRYGRKFSAEKIEEHLEELKSALSGTYLLYSIEENPDWDMQEALWQIGSRYHLG